MSAIFFPETTVVVEKKRMFLFSCWIGIFTLLVMTFVSTHETACGSHNCICTTVAHSTVVCVIVHMLVCVLIRIMNFTVLVRYLHDEWSMPASPAQTQQPEPALDNQQSALLILSLKMHYQG